MAASSRRRARGFTLPLTLTLAFSLMTLATAVVGMVVISDRQARAAAADLVTRVTLESAIEASLADLERDGEPQAPDWTASKTLNGRDVSLRLASPRYKPDIDRDAAADVGAALSDAGLRQRVVAAMTPAKGDDQPPGFSRFVGLVSAVGATPAEEDCLRRRLTLGRVEAQVVAAPPASALIPPRQPLEAGEVIEVRAELTNDRGTRDVLWRRVRFTGKPDRPWLTHDWRPLRLGRGEGDCPTVAPASASGDFRLAP
jgi:hypothetical protein